MAMIKCKMCGGDIELAADRTFGTCEFCGSAMTFPKIDDEQRAAAFNRGNHFRRIGEFDKALAVYERILQEDDADAEAHWCCALCRFGIEYVEDPATLEWLPTCHRASFDSFLEDVDYKSALAHSDGVTQRQYRKDAARIAEVQRGILATSQNTEPYEVFLCYKESDDQGNRTRDSLLAQDIYYQLTERGRRVFYARITLEDVGGAQYEPYIFAALHSAKVMVVVGTKPEHFSAVWVKNEWSRFLAMMKKDHSKLLLPCYLDMDPYGLPDQLGILQSYDMSKIGFIQDLNRGIAKVLDEQKPQQPRDTVVSGAVNVAALLKRAFMFLEDGAWASADEYCEKVLDQDPENALGYLGKLMAGLQVRRKEQLETYSRPFEENPNYQKIRRFGDSAMVAELEGYNRTIRETNERRRQEEIYQRSLSLMKQREPDAIARAAEGFRSIPGYRDADTLAKECPQRQVEAVRDMIYQNALAMMDKKEKSAYLMAIKKLESIQEWRDVAKEIQSCQDGLASLEEQARQKRLQWELEQKRKAELQRQETLRKRKKALMATGIGAAVLVALILLVMLVNSIQCQRVNDALVGKTVSGTYRYTCEYFDTQNTYTIYFVDESYCNIHVVRNTDNTSGEDYHGVDDYEMVPYTITGGIGAVEFNWDKEVGPYHSVVPFQVTVEGDEITMYTSNFNSHKSMYMYSE